MNAKENEASDMRTIKWKAGGARVTKREERSRMKRAG